MTDQFDQWAILEIMGHQKFAGRVSEQAIGGASFIRIDVPECGEIPPFTKLFGAGAIYGITPVSEEIARQLAMKVAQRPVDVYDFPPEFQERLRLAHTIRHRNALDDDDIEDADDDDDHAF